MRWPVMRAAPMLIAVFVAGGAAGLYVSRLAFISTALVLAAIVRAAARDAAPADLPERLRDRLATVLASLPDGEARRLLSEVAAQAKPIFSAPSATFDPAHEAATREDVMELVDACCATAQQLGGLELGATPAPDAQTKGAHDLLAQRLTDAAAALKALYVSGVARGTPASDRVAELAGEIRSEASARAYAAGEMSAGDPPAD